MSSAPPKLRHPSKLKSKDISSATFMRYVKHYMEYHPFTLQTDDPSLPTYSLSHLRRVPELTMLARRTVRHELKKRTHADKASGKKVTSAKPSIKDELQSFRDKMKRLFRFAIVKLHEEGSVIVWPGPPRFAATQTCAEISMMWNSQVSSDASIFSTSSVSELPADDLLDLESISDVDPNEDVYVPATIPFLAGEIESKMRTMRNRLIAKSKHSEVDCPRLHPNSPPLRPQASESPYCRRCFSQCPKADDILDALKRDDDRWQRIGGMAVEEALVHLKAESKVSEVGDGRWKLKS